MSTVNPPALKEDRAHGISSFRCAFYEVNMTGENLNVPLHWHDELEIIYFQEGIFTLEINMERYCVDQECLFFIRQGELHRIFAESPCMESAVVFSPYLLSFLSGDAAQNRLILPFTQGNLLLPRMLSPRDPAYAEIRSEYRRIVSRFSGAPSAPSCSVTDQLFIKASLLHILACFSEQKLLLVKKETKNETIESIKTVLAYIHSHYSEKITVRGLAGLLNLNEQYFCRFFKKAIGQTPIAYVNGYRIRRALPLLSDTSMQVTEICLECGFNHLGNFLREFRRHTGMTPLQYRRFSSERTK